MTETRFTSLITFRDEGGGQRRRDFSLICLKKMSERGKGKGLATFALSSSSSSSSSPESSLLDHHLLGDEREEERLERWRYDYQYYSGDDAGDEVALLSDFDELEYDDKTIFCLLYTSPSPRDMRRSRMPSSA